MVRTRGFVLCVAGLLVSVRAVGAEPPTADGAAKSNKGPSLNELLEKKGFTCVPLKRLNCGYLGISVRVGEKPLFFIVDTGAPITHLDPSRTKGLGLKWRATEDAAAKASGATGTSEVDNVEVGAVKCGRLVVGSHDLTAVNRMVKLHKDPEIDGVLGADVLENFSAVIDWANRKLYLWDGKPAKRE